MSKGILSPIMERTLESVLSPMQNKSGLSSKQQETNTSSHGFQNEERKLSGTGTYKIDAALHSATWRNEDEDQSDEDCYSDDFEDDESDDESLAMGSTGH